MTIEIERAQQTIRDVGAHFNPEILAVTQALYADQVQLSDAGVDCNLDIAFGSDPRQTLDVFKPAASVAAPILVFFPSGAFISGGKNEHRSGGLGGGESVDVPVEWARGRRGQVLVGDQASRAGPGVSPAAPEQVRDVAWAWVVSGIRPSRAAQTPRMAIGARGEVQAMPRSADEGTLRRTPGETFAIHPAPPLIGSVLSTGGLRTVNVRFLAVPQPLDTRGRLMRCRAAHPNSVYDGEAEWPSYSTTIQ